ncbi:LysR substrate-binding domain-containing protein [Kribbella sp. NPDC059898]|uniref:LysR substrate-binding domain-containing protein n=1 Tax=Kribbella sp. NPDC059898 TaxID=3346995 RepID=UPI00366671C0
MEQRELELFLHLGQSLNYGRTSLECHVSAATLTRTIQRLEARVGARLLDRGPRGVMLTAEGRRFTAYAEKALELWAGYRDAVEEDLTGELRIFATVTACQTLLPDLLRPLRDQHPQIRLALRTGDAAAALARLDEGEVDAAVAGIPHRLPQTLVTRTVAVTDLVLVKSRNTPPVTPTDARLRATNHRPTDPPGPSDPPGPRGTPSTPPPGPPGPPGPTDPHGPTDPPGPRGTASAPPPGPPGPPDPTGPTGPTGPHGPHGPHGPTGPHGPRGTPFAPPPGPPGPTDPAGTPLAPTGPAGSTGPVGTPSDPSLEVPYVVPARGLVREAAFRWFRRMGVKPTIAAEPDGHEALLALVALGCGVGVVPRLVLESSAVRDQLEELPADLEPLTIGLCARRADLHRPLVAALWALRR